MPFPHKDSPFLVNGPFLSKGGAPGPVINDVEFSIIGNSVTASATANKACHACIQFWPTDDPDDFWAECNKEGGNSTSPSVTINAEDGVQYFTEYTCLLKYTAADSTFTIVGPETFMTQEGPSVLSNPTVVALTTVGGRPQVTIDVPYGVIYYVEVAHGATAPSAPQIIAGHDASNNPALSANNLTVSATGNQLFPAITNGSASEALDVYFVCVTDFGNSNIVSVAYTTLDINRVQFEAGSKGSVLPGTLISFIHPGITPSGVGIFLSVSSNSSSATSVTYGGVAATLKASDNTGTFTTYGSVYDVDNPPPGPQEVRIVSSTSQYQSAGCISVTNGDPNTVIRNTNSAKALSGINVSGTVSAVNGDLVADAVSYNNDGNVTALGSGQTQSWPGGASGAAINTAGSTKPCVATGTITMTETLPSATTSHPSWVQILAAFKVAP